MQEFVLETASLPGAQIAPVLLPLRKPEMVTKSRERKRSEGKPDHPKKNSSAKKCAAEADALSRHTILQADSQKFGNTVSSKAT
jgi:hypothetical protein